MTDTYITPGLTGCAYRDHPLRPELCKQTATQTVWIDAGPLGDRAVPACDAHAAPYMTNPAHEIGAA